MASCNLKIVLMDRGELSSVTYPNCTILELSTELNDAFTKGNLIPVMGKENSILVPPANIGYMVVTTV